MNALKLAIRKLFRKGEHTTARIISLATGLTFGIILLSEVFYYYSYDSFYPDANQLYLVNESFNPDKQSDKLKTHNRVSGAIGPGIKAEVPGVEAATRTTPISSMFYSEDNETYNGKIVLADEYLFDVLPRPILSGMGTETLQKPMYCIVSSEIAEKMGGNVVGKIIEPKDYPGKKITIGGVFEKIPQNTNYAFDIAVSMSSIGNFMWDGSQNWLGNDRYYTVVKLAKGTSPQSLAPAVRRMQEKHQNIAELERKNGLVLKYTFEPLQKVYSNQAKDMIFILSAIAFIVLFVSVMNYLLLTVSTLVNRAKSSAILKCYGAEKRNLQAMIFSESTLIFSLSLMVAFALILILKPIAEAQVGHALSATLNAYVIVPILLILAVVIVFIGYVPGHFFARIPVAAAFRNYRRKNTQWKKALLAVQFTGAALILTMLCVVSLQYDKMKNANHGYSTKNIYYGSVSGMDPHKISTVINELNALPEVENVGMGYDVPINGASGNNVISPDGQKELFNVADFYYIDDAYLSILEIPIASGQAFKEGQSAPNNVVISQKGANLLALNNGWNDGVVGKDIEISEHNHQSSSTITGVFSDIIVGDIGSQDMRPSVFFYYPKEKFIETFEKHSSFTFLILIKTRAGENNDVMKKFTDIFNSAIPRGEAEIKSLALVQTNKYQAQKGFRNAIYAGSFVILLVTIIGLLGYLNDEIARYRKSLAIRKINGASINDIIGIFVFNIAKLALPCVVAGLTGAWFLASKWMENFTIQISLYWWIFVLSGACILALTGTVAILNSLRVARQNPVKSLRYE